MYKYDATRCDNSQFSCLFLAPGFQYITGTSGRGPCHWNLFSGSYGLSGGFFLFPFSLDVGTTSWSEPGPRCCTVPLGALPILYNTANHGENLHVSLHFILKITLPQNDERAILFSEEVGFEQAPDLTGLTYRSWSTGISLIVSALIRLSSTSLIF